MEIFPFIHQSAKLVSVSVSDVNEVKDLLGFLKQKNTLVDLDWDVLGKFPDELVQQPLRAIDFSSNHPPTIHSYPSHLTYLSLGLFIEWGQSSLLGFQKWLSQTTTLRVLNISDFDNDPKTLAVFAAVNMNKTMPLTQFHLYQYNPNHKLAVSWLHEVIQSHPSLTDLAWTLASFMSCSHSDWTRIVDGKTYPQLCTLEWKGMDHGILQVSTMHNPYLSNLRIAKDDVLMGNWLSSKVTELEVRECRLLGITNRGGKNNPLILGDFVLDLFGMRYLTKLFLKKMELDKRHLDSILLLFRHPQLQVLDLSQNYLFDSLNLLFKELANNTHLDFVNLSKQHGAGDQPECDLSELAEALENNSTLITLYAQQDAMASLATLPTLCRIICGNSTLGTLWTGPLSRSCTSQMWPSDRLTAGSLLKKAFLSNRSILDLGHWSGLAQESLIRNQVCFSFFRLNAYPAVFVKRTKKGISFATRTELDSHLRLGCFYTRKQRIRVNIQCVSFNGYNFGHGSRKRGLCNPDKVSTCFSFLACEMFFSGPKFWLERSASLVNMSSFSRSIYFQKLVTRYFVSLFYLVLFLLVSFFCRKETKRKKCDSEEI